MPMFDCKLLERFEHLSLLARRSGGRSLLAAPRQKIPGGGAELGGVRDYVAGDDYRYVNWTWCARRDELLTRTFEGDEDLHCYVLLDCSLSMGNGGPAKFDLARQIAAALAYLAVTNLDRLSVSAFSGGIVSEGPPVRHAARLPRLLRFLEELSPRGTETDLTGTAEAFVRRYQRHGPVVVISDLYDRNGFGRCFDILRHRGYEPRLVQIHETAEIEPGLLGDIELLDVESRAVRRVTVTERAVRRYHELVAEFRRSVCDYCRRNTIDYMQIASDAVEDEVLLSVLGARPRHGNA